MVSGQWSSGKGEGEKVYNKYRFLTEVTMTLNGCRTLFQKTHGIGS